MKYAVLAGSYREFEEWMRSTGETDSFYVRDERSYLGKTDFEVQFVGTGYQAYTQEFVDKLLNYTKSHKTMKPIDKEEQEKNFQAWFEEYKKVGTPNKQYFDDFYSTTSPDGSVLTEENLNQAVQTLHNASGWAQFTTSSGNIDYTSMQTKVQAVLNDGSKLVFDKDTGDFNLYAVLHVENTSTGPVGAYDDNTLHGNMRHPTIAPLFKKIEGSEYVDLPHLIDPIELRIRTEISHFSEYDSTKMLKDTTAWRDKAKKVLIKAKKPMTKEMKALKKKADEVVITINILSEHLGNLTLEATYVKNKTITLEQANKELDEMLKLDKKVRSAL